MVKQKHARSKLYRTVRFCECQDYNTFLLMPCSLVDGSQRDRRKHFVATRGSETSQRMQALCGMK